MWTQKETSFLQDLKKQEQLCVQKYRQYASDAHDPELSRLFDAIGAQEQEHVQTIDSMIGGTLPQVNAGGPPKPQAPAQPTQAVVPNPDTQKDAYLCEDALSMEKHVSSEYDTAIFEFMTPQARNVLNHIQKEEQQHGEVLFQYMNTNGMYQAG